ncbi:hypothetical protein MNBD_GAMMA23-2282 [hydrothermal vent metagenome]|uniref:Uncharacterized protein n=1 Tax=hydrothermal vent metagenome TaxID=652676 RepID=A0A3B1A4J1_9ZZZZ
MEFLFLTVSAHHASHNDAVELNVKRLKQWLDALPVMDVISTVGNLHAAIEPFNEIEMADDERLKILEIYHSVMDDILFSYDDMRLKMLPISIEERRKLQNDIMWLYLSLANGYKSIVQSSFDQKLTPNKNTTLIISIYRSMDLIIQAMLYAFRSHETPPPLSFLEINQLYMYAEYLNILDSKIKNISLGAQSTIGSLYKQILLLVVSDPYRVNSNEIVEVYFFLEKFSDLCVIDRNIESKNEEGKYFIELMEDSPPQPYDYSSKPATLSSCRTIDVWPVVQAFGEELSGEYDMNSLGLREFDSGKSSLNNAGTEQRFVEILTQQLMGQKNRGAERQLTTSKCYVAIGLSAINFYLMNKNKIKEIIEPEKTGGITVNSIDFEEQADFTLDVWQLCNKSESGYLLTIRKSILTQELVIGDVVGVIIDNGKGNIHIQVAFVRWARGDNDTFKMGVEILKGNAKSVTCRCAGDTQPYDGLYFPSEKTLDLQACVLTEKSLLLQSSTIDVVLGDKNIAIEYVSSMVETSLYIQFKYKVAVKE